MILQADRTKRGRRSHHIATIRRKCNIGEKNIVFGFLAVAVQLPWAGDWLGSRIGYIGPSLILPGLLLTGIAAAMGFNGGLVKDNK